MQARPHHIDVDRSFWLWSIIGSASAFGVGVLFAWYLKATAEWSHGLAWEAVVLRAIHIPLPRVLDWFLLFLPWLGTNITIIPAVLIAGRMLWTRGRRDLITVMVVATVGNYITGLGMKLVFDRPRPELWPQRGEFSGSSYPSGHTMMSTSVLFVFAYLLRRERGWTWPYYAALAFAMATSFSRLYLGVHWPTDVLGGAIMGTVWFAAMLRAMDAHEDELFDFDAIDRDAALRQE